MATAGDRFKMPDGSVYIVRHPAAETDGAVSRNGVRAAVKMRATAASRSSPSSGGVRGVGRTPGGGGRGPLAGPDAWRIDLRAHWGSAHLQKPFRPRGPRSELAPAGDAVEDFIERTSATLRAAGVKRKRDPRTLLYFSMVMLDFDDTLVPGRRRERLPMKALARIGRMLPVRTP